MIIFGGTSDTIFTPAFQLNPKKWCKYYTNLLEQQDLEKLTWSELIELITDAYRSISSVLRQDLYIYSDPDSIQDSGKVFKRVLERSGLDTRTKDLLIQANEQSRKLRSYLASLGEVLPRSTPAEERRRIDYEHKSQMDQIKRASEQLKKEYFQELVDVLSDMSSLLQQIPDKMLNINYPEFKEKFDLKDAHHDFRAASTLSRIVIDFG